MEWKVDLLVMPNPVPTAQEVQSNSNNNCWLMNIIKYKDQK